MLTIIISIISTSIFTITVIIIIRISINDINIIVNIIIIVITINIIIIIIITVITIMTFGKSSPTLNPTPVDCCLARTDQVRLANLLTTHC